MKNILIAVLLILGLLINFNLMSGEQKKVSIKITQKRIKIDNDLNCKILNPQGKKLFLKISLEEFKYDSIKNQNKWIELVDNLYRRYKRDTIYKYVDENNEEKKSFEYVENGKKFISYCPTVKASEGLCFKFKETKDKFKIIWYSNSKLRCVLYYRENNKLNWKKIYSSEFEVYK